MSTSIISDQLRLLVADILGLAPDQVTAQMRRDSTPTWDSLNHLLLVSAVETEFHVSLSMNEIARLQTPLELQRAIETGLSRPA
jgi:acyl carrier protein